MVGRGEVDIVYFACVEHLLKLKAVTFEVFLYEPWQLRDEYTYSFTKKEGEPATVTMLAVRWNDEVMLPPHLLV